MQRAQVHSARPGLIPCEVWVVRNGFAVTCPPASVEAAAKEHEQDERQIEKESWQEVHEQFWCSGHLPIP
jgi:hypothetical protein